MQQNEFLFKLTATNTLFGAVCCQIYCILVLNGVRFGAKCSAFCRKMECGFVPNAREKDAKSGALRINIHCNSINKTLSRHETHD